MSVSIFFCYAHEDEALLNKLKTHLRPLQRQGLIDAWHDRDISEGSEWEQEIKKHLNEANLILLLVSPDFIASDYCWGIEMKRAMERHERGEARVIPVILRPTYWQGAPFSKLHPLPGDGTPLISSSWYNQDEAFYDFAKGIYKAIEEFSASTNNTKEQNSWEKISFQTEKMLAIDTQNKDTRDALEQSDDQKAISPLRLSVFLCHSSGDKPSVRELYRRLQAEGIDPWLDEENLLPGQDWEQEIREAVRRSDIVLVCLSQNSINKVGFVQKEIKFALDVASEQPEGSIFLIPVKLEDCNVPERLRRWHWVNLFEKKGYEKLRRSLQERATTLGRILSPTSTWISQATDLLSEQGDKYTANSKPILSEPRASIEKFSRELFEVFEKHLQQDFIIRMLSEMSGGFSGARTFLVDIEPRYPNNTIVEKGKYILKVSLREDVERERQKHLQAKANVILGKYVPNLVIVISYDDIPLAGLLYEITRDDIMRQTTLQVSLEQRRSRLKQNDLVVKQIKELADVILKWNLGATHTDKSSDLLGTILQGIGRERLKGLKARLKGIVERINASRIDLTSLVDALMYNPIYFLDNLDSFKGTPLRQVPYLIPVLHLHGDLHPGNVIVSREEQADELPFQIMGFSTPRSGNLFFDLAFFEISIILTSRGGFHRAVDLKNWWELEQYLSSEYFPLEEMFRGANREVLQRVLPIREVLDARIKQEGEVFKDDYWIAFLAASVEAGLDLAWKVFYDPALQRVAFLTAASRFDHLVKLLGVPRQPLKEPLAWIYWPGEV